jgi:hypothetical protein
MANGQAALLGPSKIVLTETKMSVQAITTAPAIRAQTGSAGPSLPLLIYRINKAFLTQIVVVPVNLINKHRKALGAHFLAALHETRRREAARAIDRYQHLIEGDGYRD